MWRVEYLQTLQTHQKGMQNQCNFIDVMIVKNDIPHGHWRLARIMNTLKVPDGSVEKVSELVSELGQNRIRKRVRKPMCLDGLTHTLELLIRPDKSK